MQQPRVHLFLDAVICGVMGGAIAEALGEPFMVTALLSVFLGPFVILGASLLLDSAPESLPGKASGTYEFLAFAACVVIAIAVYRMFA